jgi:hypothetical protein
MTITTTKFEEGISKEIREILKFELNAKYKTTAIGVLVFPVLSYGSGISNCRLEEIKTN